MIDEQLAKISGVRELLNEVLEKVERLADRLDAIAGADRARVTEFLSILHPLSEAKPNGHLCAAPGSGKPICGASQHDPQLEGRI